ncbi:phosphatase PAP2 family protein [Streptomyces sp. NPDC058279]|uniref:phosphatase PAP2 family protein n=1 Tax=Streptomyces sp. NPDC058279 TaxID=3346418 RepID=UPI0036E5009B
MAGLTTGGPNVDVSLLYEINGLARRAPDWIDRAVGVIGDYGIPLALVLLVLWCWRGLRRQDEASTVESFAALVWAPLAAGIALLVNVPLRGFVGRPRPFLQHEGLEVVGGGAGGGVGGGAGGFDASGFSFVSDHATLAMALGVGLFVANRRLGVIGIGLALLEGLCRVYMGVHYPTDVVGGLALGTAVVLVPAPLAMAVLGPVVRVARRRGRGAVVARPVVGAEVEAGAGEKDLAA